jgi:hypothetical protein
MPYPTLEPFMSEAFVLWPQSRGLIRVAGADARAFLQGIVSNDVNRVAPGRAIHAAFLTPQGRYLHDFFICEFAGDLLLDCEAARCDDLLRRLARFKLRAAVTLAPEPAALRVALLYGGAARKAAGLPAEPGAAAGAFGGVAYVDPRLAELGARAVLPAAAESGLAVVGFRGGDPAAYERLRLSLGVPDASRDLEIEKSLLLECGFDELNGIDWAKGCFMGQEITARMRYRALVKRRLVPVRIRGEVPAPGTTILAGPEEVGVMRSAAGDVGLASLGIEFLDGATPLAAGMARLTPMVPAWMRFAQDRQRPLTAD